MTSGEGKYLSIKSMESDPTFPIYDAKEMGYYNEDFMLNRFRIIYYFDHKVVAHIIITHTDSDIIIERKVLPHEIIQEIK